MKRLTIGSREIGEGRPCFVVAELGVNHNGNAEKASRMIEVAASCGADAIKLQRRTVDDILIRSALDAPYDNERSFGKTYGAHRRALELPDETWPKLQQIAERLGLVFFASPYDIASVEFLSDLGVPAVKIASCDLTNTPLIDAAAQMGVPVIMSTGMSEETEIDHAVRVVWRQHTKLVLMHCVSSYPAKAEDLNLRYMKRLGRTYDTPFGWSGHEKGLATSIAALVLGASVIERHLTLNKSSKGPDHSSSLEPDEFRRLVRDIRDVEAALVEHKKHVLPSERAVRDRLAKSIATCRIIGAGEVVERSALCLKGPGNGISPLLMDTVIGRRAIGTIPADILLSMDRLK